MKTWWIFTIFVFSLITDPAYSAQSTIVEVEAYFCMGYDKSRQKTEELALDNAKRKAAEYASTYIMSETKVENSQLKKDLIKAYSNATVKVIQELERLWYKDQMSGDCFKVKISAEVIPDDSAMARIAQEKTFTSDPMVPLNVEVWTDKKEYKQSEKIKIYIRGNKPFYARVLYKDAKGELMQLLPNPYRSDNYFNGGIVCEIPSGNDRFELEVNPPFGSESIITYASSSPLGDLSVKKAGGIYQVETRENEVGVQTRSVKLKGIKIKDKETGKEAGLSEFSEGKWIIKTGK